jgi:nitroreductase
VPEDKLERILEAVRLAPSAHNSQPYKLIVVRDEEKKQHLASAAQNQAFIAEASIIIAGVLLEPKEEMALISLAIIIDHLTLAAAAEGLGTCWIGAFSQEEVKKILNIPEEYKVAILMPLGIPADSAGAKERKALEDLICDESFKE